jgi:uncharacterized membrane protein YjjP (DUF1212 family)
VTSTFDKTSSVAPIDTLEVLLRFGILMLQAGNTAVRTRKWIDAIAPKLCFEAVSAIVSLDSITVSVRCGSEWFTAMRELGPPGINVSRIAQLEQLARTLRPETPPAELGVALTKIESAAPRYSFAQPWVWQAAALLFSVALPRPKPLQQPSVAVAANGYGCG